MKLVLLALIIAVVTFVARYIYTRNEQQSAYRWLLRGAWCIAFGTIVTLGIFSLVSINTWKLF